MRRIPENLARARDVLRGASMKKIEALIRPHLLEDVTARLRAEGVQGMTVSEVQASGHGTERKATYRGVEVAVDFSPLVMLTLVARDDHVSGIAQAILEVADAGGAGDGRIVVTPVVEAVSIRTGERGSHAIVPRRLAIVRGTA
jgi:nitrogen regulatory protein P-II 1